MVKPLFKVIMKPILKSKGLITRILNESEENPFKPRRIQKRENRNLKDEKQIKSEFLAKLGQIPDEKFANFLQHIIFGNGIESEKVFEGIILLWPYYFSE